MGRKKKTETEEPMTDLAKLQFRIEVLSKKIALLTEIIDALCTLVDKNNQVKRGLNSEDLP